MQINRQLLHPRYLHHWILLGILRLTALLPLSSIGTLGRIGGTLLYWLAPFRRKVAETNIRLCFPKLSAAEQRELVKNTFYSNIMGLLETAAGWWGNPERIRPRIRYTGFEKLHNLNGQGAILLGCHLTTLDFAGRMIAMNADIDVVYRTQKYPVYDYVMLRARERIFKNVIERSDMRQLLRSVKQGRVVWYAPDQDYGRKNAVFAPFFGVPAATLTATGRLAKMTGAPLYIYKHYREADGNYHAIIEGPIENFPRGDELQDATTVNQLIEAAVRAHPEQYMWLHKRFKSQPEGKNELYPKRRRKRKHSRHMR